MLEKTFLEDGLKAIMGILSVEELEAIEREIDEINAHADLLDPSIPDESEQLYYYDIKLTQHLDVLRSSFNKTRIKELGLTIVPLPTV